MNRQANRFLIIFLNLLFIFLAGIRAQDDSLYRFFKKINYPVSSFTVDNIGELYIINSNNQLKKYDANGDSIGVFNEVTKYGKLSFVAAQNPWKTLLLYQNYSTIVLLDKYLQSIGTINLRNKNIYRVKAITSSYDNKIWLFDEQDNKLKKIDDNGNVELETTDFRLLFDNVPTPQKIVDNGGFVYLYDPENGLYVFDYYGAFKNKLTFLGWNGFEVIDKVIYGFDQLNLYKYTPPLPDLSTTKLPVFMENAKSIELQNHKIYFLADHQLNVYSLQ